MVTNYSNKKGGKFSLTTKPTVERLSWNNTTPEIERDAKIPLFVDVFNVSLVKIWLVYNKCSVQIYLIFQ